MKTFLDFVENKKQHTFSEEILNEAFRNGDVSKSLKLITSLFKKNIGKTVVMDPTPTPTISNRQQCMSYFWYYYKEGKLDMMWKFNFVIDAESSAVYSIDFFNGQNAMEFWLNDNGTKTNLTIFTMGSSIAYFLPICYHIINNHVFTLKKKDVKNAAMQIFKENAVAYDYYIGALNYRIYEGLTSDTIYKTFCLNIGNLNEANEDPEVKQIRRDAKDARDAAYRKKVRTKNPDDKADFEKLSAEYDAIVKAIRGGAKTVGDLELALKKNVSTNLNIPNLAAQQKEIEKHDTPEEAFKKMQKYIKLVTKGAQPALIICGAPGVGKTYNVKKQLKAAGYNEGHNLCTIKGKAVPRFLYLSLYDNRRKGDIVLVDDADCLVGPKAPEDCINILKAALDSTEDDEGRLVSYGVSGPLKDDEGVPVDKKFYYKGGIIVLTNYQAGALNTALRGRAYVQDMKFTTQDILDRIKSIMPDIAKNVAGPKAKIKAFDYLQELLASGAPMDLSMRGFVLCAKLFQAQSTDPDWDEDMCKEMIKEQMKMQAARASSRATY